MRQQGGQSGTVAVSCPILSKGIRTALRPTRHFATCISYKIKAEHSTILSLMQSWAQCCFASTGAQDSPVKWFQVASKSALFGHCKHFCKSRTIQAVDNFLVALFLVTNFATFLSVHFWHLQPGGTWPGWFSSEGGGGLINATPLFTKSHFTTKYLGIQFKLL